MDLNQDLHASSMSESIYTVRPKTQGGTRREKNKSVA